jgi:hypothetical protein
MMRRFEAPVDKAAIGRVLATITINLDSGILDGVFRLAPGVDASTLDAAQHDAIKQMLHKRWGAAVGTLLGFLKALVQRRERSRESRALKRVQKSPKAHQFACELLRAIDPSAVRGNNLKHLFLLPKDLAWASDEFIAGQMLPEFYRATFGKRPTMTRNKNGMSESIHFVQAVLREVGIAYKPESIISAMFSAKKRRRRR